MTDRPDINMQEAERQIRASQLSKGLVLGSMAAASAAGALIFKPGYKKGDIGYIVAPFANIVGGFIYGNMRPPAELDDELAERIFGAFEDAFALSDLKTKPELTVVKSELQNAFAIGIFNQKVVVTKNLAENQTREGLTAIFSHELAHIGNGDAQTLLLFSVLTSTTMKFVIDPIVQSLGLSEKSAKRVQFVVSNVLVRTLAATVMRPIEAMADTTSVLATGKPDELTEALRRIENKPKFGASVRKALWPMFRTHPTIDQRADSLGRLAL